MSDNLKSGNVDRAPRGNARVFRLVTGPDGLGAPVLLGGAELRAQRLLKLCEHYRA